MLAGLHQNILSHNLIENQSRNTINSKKIENRIFQFSFQHFKNQQNFTSMNYSLLAIMGMFEPLMEYM
jgi:hypothetical protein